MIRLGIVDFDTSHAVEFTRRLNHVGIAEDQWVEGARVVAGVPGVSEVAPEVIPKNLETLKGRCCTKALAGMIGSSRLGCPGPTHTP